MKITEYDIGDQVICDGCSLDMTRSTESGGFIFSSKAYCPTVCAARMMASIIGYNEQSYIRATCPPSQSFADFVRAYRGGNNKVRIISGD